MRFYRQLGRIEAMTFDLDDTLYDNRPIIRRVEAQATEWLHTHHPISASKSNSWWQEIKYQVAEKDSWLRNDVTLWRLKSIEYGLIQLGYNVQQAHQAATDLVDLVLELRSDFKVPDSSLQVLDKLSKTMPLVAITNGNVDIHKIGLSRYFSKVLKAGADGRAKPHQEMYHKAVQFLELPAKSILHVGDHLITDVHGAKRSGLSACWFNDQNKIIRNEPKTRTLPDVEVNLLHELILLNER